MMPWRPTLLGHQCGEIGAFAETTLFALAVAAMATMSALTVTCLVPPRLAALAA